MDSASNVLITSLFDALDILGDYAKDRLVAVLKTHHKIRLSEQDCSPKEEIEAALITVLGAGGNVLVRLWNEKLEVVGYSSEHEKLNSNQRNPS